MREREFFHSFNPLIVTHPLHLIIITIFFFMQKSSSQTAWNWQSVIHRDRYNPKNVKQADKRLNVVHHNQEGDDYDGCDEWKHDQMTGHEVHHDAPPDDDDDDSSCDVMVQISGRQPVFPVFFFIITCNTSHGISSSSSCDVMFKCLAAKKGRSSSPLVTDVTTVLLLIFPYPHDHDSSVCRTWMTWRESKKSHT